MQTLPHMRRSGGYPVMPGALPWTWSQLPIGTQSAMLAAIAQSPVHRTYTSSTRLGGWNYQTQNIK